MSRRHLLRRGLGGLLRVGLAYPATGRRAGFASGDPAEHAADVRDIMARAAASLLTDGLADLRAISFRLALVSRHATTGERQRGRATRNDQTLGKRASKHD
jgi:hypothetical protein